MKYIFLTGSIFFGIVGISQAMDEFTRQTGPVLMSAPIFLKFQYMTLSFQPFPGFVRIILLSVGFFALFLIWNKLKKLGIGKLWEYIPC